MEMTERIEGRRERRRKRKRERRKRRRKKRRRRKNIRKKRRRRDGRRGRGHGGGEEDTESCLRYCIHPSSFKTVNPPLILPKGFLPLSSYPLPQLHPLPLRSDCTHGTEHAGPHGAESCRGFQNLLTPALAHCIPETWHEPVHS